MIALVTGATGLLGGNLVRALRTAGQDVRVLVRDPEQAARALAGLDVEFISGDVTQVTDWAPALTGVDVVYGCAAYFSEYYGPGNHHQALQRVNVDAAIALAQAADRHQVRAFVHISTIGITGPAARPGEPSDESRPPNARSLKNGYHSSKWRAEQELSQLVPRLDVLVPFVRPGWLLGPGDGAAGRVPTASGQLILDVARGALPAVPPGGNHCTDARDVAAVLMSAAATGRSGVAYHAAAPWMPMRDVVETVAEEAQVAAPRRDLPPAMAYLVAVAAETQARFTGRRPLATRDGVAALQEERRVTSERAINELGATFRPLQHTVRDELDYFRRIGMLPPDRGTQPGTEKT